MGSQLSLGVHDTNLHVSVYLVRRFGTTKEVPFGAHCAAERLGWRPVTFRLADRGECFLVQLDLGGSEVLLQVLHRRGARNQGDNR